MLINKLNQMKVNIFLFLIILGTNVEKGSLKHQRAECRLAVTKPSSDTKFNRPNKKTIQYKNFTDDIFNFLESYNTCVEAKIYLSEWAFF